MAKKKRTFKRRQSPASAKLNTSFAAFIEQPHIAAALLVFALIALFLSLLEFSQALR